jgi:hypothetical protein
VHLVGFIIKKFVTMQHGHMNVKKKITSGINIHHLVSRLSKLIIQVMEIGAVCITTGE